MENVRPSYLNDVDAAKYMGFSKQTLRNWRSMAQGPPYIKLKRAVRYRAEDLDKFMTAHKIAPNI